MGSGIRGAIYAGFTPRQVFFNRHKANSHSKANDKELAINLFPTIKATPLYIKRTFMPAMGKLRDGIIEILNPEFTSRKGSSNWLKTNALPIGVGLTILTLRDSITNAIGKSFLT